MKKFSWVSKVVVFCLLIVQLGVVPIGYAVEVPPTQVEGVVSSAADANLMLAGVEVRAFLKTSETTYATTSIDTLTDAQGYYKFSNLIVGTFKLKFFKEGFQEAMTDNVNIVATAPVVVLNMSLSTPSTNTGGTNGNQTNVNGNVKNSDNASISGVSVQAFRKLVAGVGYETNPAATNMTSTDGNFSLGLEPGLYKIKFTKSGYSNHESADITVTTGTQVPFDVVLNETISVTTPPAQTNFPNASGTVKTADNLAIVGVMVKAFKKIDGIYATLSEPNQATTDGSGQYSFILPSGTYKFQFMKENYQEKELLDIVLTEGGTKSINDVVLVKYPYLITGVIKDNSVPAVGMHALIALFKKNNTSTVSIATESSGDSDPIAETMSGSDGTFTIGVMDIGEYQLVVKPDKVGGTAYLTKIIESIIIASSDTTKAIGDIDTQPGVEFIGKLVDGASNGVKGEVMVKTKESVSTTIPMFIDFSATDDLGNFTVVVPLLGQFNLVIPVPNQSPILRNFPATGNDFGAITIPTGGGNTGTQPLKIVNGIVYDVDGTTLVTNAYMQYVEMDANGGEITGTQIGENVSSTGTFGFNPQSGKSYKIKQIEFMKLNVWNRIELNYLFAVNAEGKMHVNGVEMNSFNITLPSPNLIATFTESGSVIADAWIEIEHLDKPTTTGSYAKSRGKTDANGVLKLVLPAGKSYKISSIGTKNFWQETDILFNIASTGTTTLPVELSGNANVTVTVLKNGLPLPEGSPAYGVGVGSRTDFSKHYNKQTNSTGVASFELAPGQYEVNGLSLNIEGMFEWINVNQTFDVTAVHTKDAPLVITVNLKEPNVSGTLTGSNNLPVADAWVQFRKVDDSAVGETSTAGTAGEMTKTFGASTNQLGFYKINLEAGKYVVEGYHKWDATTKTGGFTSLGIEIYVTVEAKVFNLGVPVPNLVGKVFRSGGTIAWSNIDLIFQKANLTQEQQMNAYKYEKRAETSADGSYSLFVSDGQYVLKAISSPTRWLEMNNVFTFTVAGGVVTASTGFTVAGDKYNIIPQPGNVTGTIVNFDGTPLTTSATGSVRRASVHVSTDWSKQKADATEGTDGTATTTPMQWKSYGAELQENGSFELLIDTAGDYMLQDVGIEGVDTAGNPTWSHIAINKAFKIVAASDIISFGSIGTNVKGIAQLEGANVANGGVVIRSRGLTKEQKLEPWKYDKWASTNNQGAFEMYLEPGDYEVFAISGANQWVEVRSDFTIAAPVAGQPSTGTDLGTITVTSNVSGTVKDKDGQPLGNGRVEISKLADSSSGTTAAEQYFGAQTDSQGAFKSSLKDGNYVIKGVGFQTSFMALTYPFKIEGNVMKTMSGVILTTIAIQPNVSGVAKEDLSSTAAIADAWITIKPSTATDSDWSNAISLHTDSAGSFGTFLAPGDYKVVNIGAANFHRQLNIGFTVNLAGVLEAAAGYSDNVVSGQLIIAPPAPNFKGIVKNKDDVAVANAWISVRLDDGTTGWDPDKHFGFGTNNEGKFTGKLETGNYIVVSVSTPQSWKEYNIPFSLDASGSLSSTLSTVVVNGELIIKPQQANVVGVVKDKDGNLLTQGWLSIKPASAGENEWSGAKWTETNSSGAFEVYLPAGNYVVAHAGNNTTWIDARTPFTVAADGTALTSTRSGAVVNNQLVVEPPSPNVVGTLYANKLGDGVDQKVANGWFSVVRIDSSNNILDRNGIVAKEGGANITVSDRQNIWQHSYWYNSNAAGEFAFNQEPGTYYVLFAGGSTVNYEPGTVFTVTASTSTTLDIRPAGDNFTGVITGLVQEQLALSYVQYWIEVVDVNDSVGEQRSWFIPVTDDGDSATTGVGKYSFNLPLGTYKMKGINSPFGFNDLSGSANFDVTSSAAIVKDVDLSVQTKVKGIVKRNTVAITTVATVMLIEVDSSNATEDKKLIQTDATGNFAFVRKEGFTYKIAKVATDSWHAVDDADTSTPALVDPITIDANYNTADVLNVNFTQVTP